MLKRIRTAGQAIIEFAFAALLLSLLLAAAIDLGLIFFTLQGLHNAAQEGATYASLMEWEDNKDYHCHFNPDDCSISKDEDSDGDTFIHGDIFKSSQFLLSPEELTRKVEEQTNPDVVEVGLYPGFVNMVRYRTVYEAGQAGGVMRSRLRDLNGDGQTDDINVLKTNIDVNVTTEADENSFACDPSRTTEQCYIHVVVRAKYKIFFPLSPAFREWVNLRSHYSVPLTRRGFNEGGASTQPPTKITNTPTVTSSEVLTAPTPTATPVVTICDGLSSNVTDVANWSYDYIGGGDEVIGRAHIDGQQVELCGAGLQIEEAGVPEEFDYAYYVYKNDEAGRNKVQFMAYLDTTTWEAATNGSKEHDGVGLMIRRTPSNAEAVPFAGIIYRDGQIAFEYRDSIRGDVQIYGSRTDVSGGVWLRLERYEDTVAASFNTSTGPEAPPGDADEWVRMQVVGDSTFLQIPAFDPANTVNYGLVLASGNRYMPGYDNDGNTARAAFQGVQWKDMEGFDVAFDHPDPNEEPLEVKSRDDPFHGMDFRLVVEEDGGGSINIERVEYTLSKDDVTSAPWEVNTGNSGDLLCTFGGTSAPNDCAPATEDFYNALQQLGGRGVYTIRATVYLDNGETRPATSRFELPELYFEFVEPANLTDGDRITVENREETRFEIATYDPKYGGIAGNNGYGIQTITYRVSDVPGGGTTLYEQTHTTPIDQPQMCLFGKGGGECNMMPEDVYNAMIPDQEYFVRASVTTQDQNDEGQFIYTSDKTLSFVRESINVDFYIDGNGNNQEPLTQNMVIDTEEKSRFEVEVWDLGAGANPANGDGIDRVRVEILGVSGSALGYNSGILEIILEIDEPKFCVFGRTGNNCNVWDEYYALESGKYEMRVQAILDGGDTWVPVTLNVPTVVFEIPKLPVVLNFVDATGAVVDNSEIRYVTSRDDLDDLFRVHAYKEGGPDQNGWGIAQVRFELFVYPKASIDLDEGAPEEYVLDAMGNSARPYCTFDGAGNTCGQMPEDLFNSLRGDHQYYVRAQAQIEIPGGDEGAWSDPEEFYFEIPPIVMKFVDPDPNDPDAPDEDDVVDGDEYYYEDGYKVVRDLDATEFEIVAYDPRQCGTSLPETCKDDPMDDACFNACQGVGIDRLDFDVYGPYDEDEDRYRRADMIDDLSEAGGSDEMEYVEGSNDPMCVFEADGSSCKMMYEDEDDPEEEFLQLDRGKYFVTARVRSINGYWTTEVIEREFYLEDLHLEFLDDDWDRVLAYDPRVGRESGDGIDRVEFRLYAPDHETDDPWPWKVESTNPITVTVDPDPDGDEHVDGEPYCMFGYNTSESRCYGRPAILDEDMVSGRYRVEAEVWGIHDDDYSVEEQTSFTWDEGRVRTAFVNPEIMSDTLTVRDAGVISPTTLTDIEVLAGPKNSLDLFDDNGVDVRAVRAIIERPDGTTEYLELTTPPYCIFGTTNNRCEAMDPTEPSGRYKIIVRAQEDDGTYFLWSDPEEMVYTFPGLIP